VCPLIINGAQVSSAAVMVLFAKADGGILRVMPEADKPRAGARCKVSYSFCHLLQIPAD
jgi:hypothetical protein